MKEKKNVYRSLVGKPDGKRPPGQPRCRWVSNIKMDLVEIGWSRVDWIGVAGQGQVESSCERHNKLADSIRG
jgi:hypothetical protein